MTIADHTHRTALFALFEYMKRTPTFLTMEQTVEASPWHREANVLVHTEMVVGEYVRMTDELNCDWSRDDFLGGVACVFHDTGKPASKIEKYREDRGNYFAFHGHETVSSRLFETFAGDNPSLFTSDEIYKICWMIEHHMPWSVENTEKRRQLALTAKQVGVDIYVRALMADQLGRIADDKEAKDKRANEWVAEFIELTNTVQPNETAPDAPILFVTIAASGSGKTTMIESIRMTYPDVNVFALDELRHQFYDDTRTKEGYRNAFEQAVNDKTFESRADSIFTSMVRELKPLVVDNTNTGAKRRGKYITQARRLGYRIVAITMPVSLQTILDRQHIRPDKTVPDDAVERQYNSIQQPMFGEFDEIVVSDHNLELALEK